MQPAQVISFGFKLVGWVAPLVRARERLRGPQRGGAAAAVRRRGRHARVARRQGPGGRAADGRLGSAWPPAEGLAHPARRLVALGCEVACCAARSARSAATSRCSRRPRSARSPSRGGGRGGSSAMPHKRNPVAAMIALAAATRAAPRRRACWPRWPGARARPRQLAGRARRVAGAVPRGARRRSDALADARAGLASTPRACAPTSSAAAAWCSPRRSRRCSRRRSARRTRTRCSPDCRRGRSPSGIDLRTLCAPAGARRDRRGVAIERRVRCRRRGAPGRRVATAQLDRLAQRAAHTETADDHRPRSRTTIAPTTSSRGLDNRRAVLGDAWVDKSLDGATAFNAEFQSLITRYAWHDIWGRPGLDHTTRRLLVLGMTMGLARWEEFELHCRAADAAAACRSTRSRKR